MAPNDLAFWTTRPRASPRRFVPAMSLAMMCAVLMGASVLAGASPLGGAGRQAPSPAIEAARDVSKDPVDAESPPQALIDLTAAPSEGGEALDAVTDPSTAGVPVSTG